ncbi:hypothetical protein ACJX0J_019999, partial [Zea mays]
VAALPYLIYKDDFTDIHDQTSDWGKSLLDKKEQIIESETASIHDFRKKGIIEKYLKSQEMIYVSKLTQNDDGAAQFSEKTGPYGAIKCLFIKDSHFCNFTAN